MVQVQRSAEIDGNQPIPQLDVGIEEIRKAVPARVVDQDLDKSRDALETSNSFLYGLIVGDVDGEGVRLSATAMDPFDRLRRRRAINVKHADHDPLVRETATDGSANRAPRRPSQWPSCF